jgi:hypothetical protein
VAGHAKVECIFDLHSIMKWEVGYNMLDIVVEPIVQSLSNCVFEVWSRGLVVGGDKVECKQTFHWSW